MNKSFERIDTTTPSLMRGLAEPVCSSIMVRIMKYLLYALLANFILTSTIDTFFHPDMTRTRVFLRTPQTFLWNFK
jgi:hypothetical protein